MRKNGFQENFYFGLANYSVPVYILCRNYFQRRQILKTEHNKAAERLSCALFAIHDGITDTLVAEFLNNEKDLSMKQHLVMTKVCNMMKTAPAGIPLKDLAAALRLTPGTVSELVEKLVRKGALQRVQNPSDRRAVMITVTESSFRKLKEAEKKVNDYLDTLWADFTAEEKDKLLCDLEKLTHRIEVLKK